jgi:RNA polymerase sigma-70 factor, ECF subfamily
VTSAAEIKEKTVADGGNDFDSIKWFELYGDYLFAFARQRVREQSAAEDLVQETFLAAIRSSRSFAGKSSEKSWLVGILKHKIYDYYRKNNRQIDSTDEATDLSGFNYMFERNDEWKGHWNDSYAPAEWNENSPFRQVEAGEFQIVLSRCLNGLSERAANAFVMREIDGLTSEEICGVLMISSNNYWTMMHRARLHLRRCIEVNWFAAPFKDNEANS